MTGRWLAVMIAMGCSSLAVAEEVGIGRGDPDVEPPAETTEASDGFWQELVEWFDMDGE